MKYESSSFFIPARTYFGGHTLKAKEPVIKPSDIESMSSAIILPEDIIHYNPEIDNFVSSVIKKGRYKKASSKLVVKVEDAEEHITIGKRFVFLKNSAVGIVRRNEDGTTTFDIFRITPYTRITAENIYKFASKIINKECTPDNTYFPLTSYNGLIHYATGTRAVSYNKLSQCQRTFVMKTIIQQCHNEFLDLQRRRESVVEKYDTMFDDVEIRISFPRKRAFDFGIDVCSAYVDAIRKFVNKIMPSHGHILHVNNDQNKGALEIYVTITPIHENDLPF